MNYLQRYGLAVVSIGVALGISLLLQHFGFRVPSALLLLFAVAISSWYAGGGPAVLAAILSTISFYWYFVEPVHTIYIYPSQIPYFVIFTAFAAILSWFGTFRQRAEADLRRTHDQLKGERSKLGSRTIAVLYFAFSSCWILFTDRVVHGLGLSNAYLLRISEAKGILFISLSTLLMYVLVEKALRQRHSVANSYWQLVETAQEGVWSVDAEGKTVFANENMAGILGTSPGEMIGKSILPFVPQEKKDELLNHLLQREQGLQEHYEFPFLRADGAQVWTFLRLLPVLGDGRRSGCLVLATDITKRKRAEEALRESETRFRTLVGHVADAIFVYDFEQGTIVDLNPQACEGLGYAREELVGKTGLAFHPDANGPALETVAERAAAGEMVIDTHWHRRKDGTLFPVEVHTSLFWYSGRRFLLKIARDISDRLRAEEAVRRSERQLRDVIDTIPTYVWSASPDGPLDFLNKRCLEFSGGSLEESLGAGWEHVLHPEDRDRFLEEARAAFTAGEPFETEARYRRADGQYRWLLVRAVPLRDEKGTIVKWYGANTDIDDRKRAEEALKRSEAYLADAQRLTHTGAWASDGATRPLYWSEEVFRIYGFDPKNGLPAWEQPLERVHPEDRDRFWQAFQRTICQKVDNDVEYRVLLPDGTLKHVYALAHPVLNSDGDLAEVVGTVVDITERKRAEEERERLRELEADLAHIDRVSMMGELAASIAHEINQPLAGIVSNGGACLRWLTGDEPNVEEAREAVRDIVRDGKRAGEIIARIRAMTKRTAPPREKLEVTETIREVLALLGDEAKRRSVVIRTQFAEDLSNVSGDRVQLQQVVLKLVMNAMDAMSTVVDRERQLVITTQNIAEERVEVTVEDSGIGLDPNTMARIFEPFYTTKSGGMGMGLSISRSILQRHRGSLWATANDGPGTSFHFTLPKYQGEESHAGTAAD